MHKYHAEAAAGAGTLMHRPRGFPGVSDLAGLNRKFVGLSQAPLRLRRPLPVGKVGLSSFVSHPPELGFAESHGFLSAKPRLLAQLR
jgi:hypothetical protein